MAQQVKSSGLYAKYGASLDQAVEAVADKPVVYGGGSRLPPGINNGIAKLSKAYFAAYQSGDLTGEYYFRAEGVVVTPSEVAYDGETIPVRGLSTSIMMPACQTRKKSDGSVTSQEENIDKILNEMRKLGVETAGIKGQHLEAVAESLVDAGPFFRFRTSPRKNQQTGEVDGAWENWDGSKGLESYSPPDDGDGVEDDTTSFPAPAPAKPQPAPAAPAKAQVAPAKPAAAPAPAPAKSPQQAPRVAAAPSAAAPKISPKPAAPPTSSLPEDPTELAVLADAGDEPAQTKLGVLAAAAGIGEDEVTNAPTFAAVADMIREKTAGAGEPPVTDPAESSPDGEDWVPAIGDIYSFKPTDAKTKKKAAKGLEVKIVSVSADGTTVELENVVNPKLTYAAVPKNELESTD